MENSISDKLDPNTPAKTPFGLKALSTLHRVTMNPSSSKPDETIYLNIP